MKTFFLLVGLVGCSLSAQTRESKARSLSFGDEPFNKYSAETKIPIQPARNKRSLSDSESPLATSSTGKDLTTWKPTCDPTLISSRFWNFGRPSGVTDAFACVKLCVEEGSIAGISALIDLAPLEHGKFLFEQSIFISFWLQKFPLAIALLTTYHNFSLPIEVFKKVREHECKPVLMYLMHGWRYRYTGTSPLEIMDEIVASCVYFKEPHLLHAFLCGCPFLSAGTIKAFEDAIIGRNSQICSAIFRSGVLGLAMNYVRMSPGLVLYRQSLRAKILDLVLKGNALQLHAHITDIEIPFVMQMLTKSIHQPRSFVYLISKFGEALLEPDALSLYQAVCISGHKDVFKQAFKVISGLKYDLPMLFHALKSARRHGAYNIIHYARSLNYEPQPNEVAKCVEVMTDNVQIASLLKKCWPNHFSLLRRSHLCPDIGLDAESN